MTPPIISHDAKVLTKFYSSFILFTEKANVIVTAKGNPSGTATTIIVTPIMKNLSILYKQSICQNYSQKVRSSFVPYSMNNRTNRMMNVNIATTTPTLPIVSATASNFTYKGVGVLSLSPNFFISFCTVLSPTYKTNITPVPSLTFVPDIKNGDLPF